MPTLVVEDGTGLSNANSYVSVADADTYHDSRLHSEAWAGTDADKGRALIWATRLLDEQIEWLGYKTKTTQALGWPRWGLYDREGLLISGTSVPAWLKNATAELARQLIEADRATDAGAPHVSSKTVGPLSISYATASGQALTIIPPSVRSLVPIQMLKPGRVMRA